MINTKLSILIYLLAFFISPQSTIESNLSLLDNKIPTDTPLVFAPGIISTKNNKEFGITFNSEMNELFFTRKTNKKSFEIYMMRLKGLKWSKPEIAPFTSDYEWDYMPHINPSGDKIYFGSTRNLNDTTRAQDVNQWYCEKRDKKWSSAKLFGKPFSRKLIPSVTSSENGNLYFTYIKNYETHADANIYYAINQNGQYESIKKMGEEINSKKWISNPYIAPDESYIIYDAEKNSVSAFENADLYISFNHNGIWSKPYSLGPKINTKSYETAASVSPDGKYLFFTRSSLIDGDSESSHWEDDIYWVDFITLKKELLKKQ
ncbi:TolB-like translocation protein [Aquimarina pacifica]|uniref:PD40 domain-containing protein n=1 Tax=Aquimarina pacifica TaxID=1296415 RepID=UPI00047141E0|nr:PD40 domain-containing protein [Aquimarina pacifica]